MNATIAASKETAPPGDSSVLDIPLERIRESTTNPRRVFDETKLREFADNIQSRGALPAIFVRPAPDVSAVAEERQVA
jgi:ParB-like chromosome segregation protein Spo0J